MLCRACTISGSLMSHRYLSASKSLYYSMKLYRFCEGLSRGGNGETRGERYFLASRKYQRTCVCVGSWLLFCRGSFMKKGLKSFGKASFPHISNPFFSLLRKPAERSSADCRFGVLCESCAVFSAEKRAGEGAPLRRRDSEARSFRRSVAAFPRGRNHTTARQADGAAIVPVKRARKKGLGRWRASLLAIRIPDPFFVSPAATFTATKRLPFGWVLGRGLWAPKPPP